MALVLACAEGAFDAQAGTCAQEVWIDQPALLPPLSADEGLLLFGAMTTTCAIAWSLKALRRFIWPRA